MIVFLEKQLRKCLVFRTVIIIFLLVTEKVFFFSVVVVVFCLFFFPHQNMFASGITEHSSLPFI